MEKVLRIKQVKSESKLNPRQQKTLKALGLRGVGTVAIRKDLRAIRGMLNVLHHVIQAEQLDAPVDRVVKNKTKTFSLVK